MCRKLIFASVFAVFVAFVPSANAANRLYDRFHAALVSYTTAGLTAPIDMATDTIRIACVSPAYTPNTATDQFFTSISTSVVGAPVTLTYGSSVAGVYKSANNPAFTVPASATVRYFVIYKDTGTAGTSPLIALFDTATGLPYTSGTATTTLNVTMNSTNGWFKP
jgi:hypothetical protein